MRRIISAVALTGAFYSAASTAILLSLMNVILPVSVNHYPKACGICIDGSFYMYRNNIDIRNKYRYIYVS